MKYINVKNKIITFKEKKNPINLNLLILKIQQKRRKEEYTPWCVFMCRAHKTKRSHCCSRNGLLFNLIWLWSFVKAEKKKVSTLLLPILPATHSAHYSQRHCPNVPRVLSHHCYQVPPTSLVCVLGVWFPILHIPLQWSLLVNQVILQYLKHGSHSFPTWNSFGYQNLTSIIKGLVYTCEGSISVLLVNHPHIHLYNRPLYILLVFSGRRFCIMEKLKVMECLEAFWRITLELGGWPIQWVSARGAGNIP